MNTQPESYTYKYESTKVIPLGSCAFRQPFATSHCKFIHGYRLQAKFWFGCNELDENNWVVDFGGLKQLKANLEQMFDHTTVIWGKDPERPLFEFLHSKGIIDLRIMEDGVGIEKFAEYCLKTANEFITNDTKNRCNCFKVEIWEHENNSAICELAKTQIEVKPVVNAPPAPPVKLNSPPLNAPKTYNSFKDPFAGTSWGNNAKR